MMFAIHWDDPEKTRLMIRPDGPWSWDEYYTAGASLVAQVEQAAHPVVILVDMSDARAQRPPPGAFLHGPASLNATPDNVRAYIFFPTSTLMRLTHRSVGPLLSSKARRLIVFASSLDHARTLARQLLTPDHAPNG